MREQQKWEKAALGKAPEDVRTWLERTLQLDISDLDIAYVPITRTP
jgi:hypothetical protein